MSHGIMQSIKFTAKLLDVMENLLGSAVMDMADKIVPSDERQQWLSAKKEDEINTYIKNMKFTITFLDILKKQHGNKIVDITNDLMSKEEDVRWCKVAQQESDHSVENFVRLLWEPLISLGFKFTVDKQKNGVQINCTACPIHELSKLIGGAEWLSILECNKDLHNVSGFNKKIGVNRTKTLMKGDSCCNHFYYENK